MIKAEDYIKQAGQLADEEIISKIHGDYMSVESSNTTMKKMEFLLLQALEIEPDNPEFHYWLICSKLASGMGKSGFKEIEKIAKKFPQYVEIAGVMADPQRWFAPFFYPSWHEDQKELPEELCQLPYGGTLLASVRHGMRRIVCMFRHLEKSNLQREDFLNAPMDVRFNFMETPDGPVVGVYVLITLPKGNLYISETIINVDACPASFRDLSNAGHWLLKLLSQQDYTFVILNDPHDGILFNQKLKFNPGHKKELKEIRAKLDTITPKAIWNQESFIKAQNYYMNNFSIEDLF
ncbi:MAG: hypothetical protein AB1454_14160 [Candidatus Auribacterota bacterium]|jgi:hypothetical protein|uniref:Uncharacterized protein n=1 Tax=Candidatus Auribacter fodinae TaxID=2093366 RepID=A0A3A4RA79_9BACT|nr:MAG: hypothetical protein C4541_00900 [Candidatus Auribacter fodinae]